MIGFLLRIGNLDRGGAPALGLQRVGLLVLIVGGNRNLQAPPGLATSIN